MYRRGWTIVEPAWVPDVKMCDGLMWLTSVHVNACESKARICVCKLSACTVVDVLC